ASSALNESKMDISEPPVLLKNGTWTRGSLRCSGVVPFHFLGSRAKVNLGIGLAGPRWRGTTLRPVPGWVDRGSCCGVISARSASFHLRTMEGVSIWLGRRYLTW